MDLAEARQFLATHHCAVLATRRRDGRLQMSPITVGVDAAGRAIISSRETAYKTRHLRRDPRASLCVFMDEFYGPWVQIDGTAEVVSLPDAMEPLVDYYRRIAGEHATGMTIAVLWNVIGVCSCVSASTALARIGKGRSVTGLVFAKNILCVYGSLSRSPDVGTHFLRR